MHDIWHCTEWDDEHGEPCGTIRCLAAGLHPAEAQAQAKQRAAVAGWDHGRGVVVVCTATGEVARAYPVSGRAAAGVA